MMKQVMVLAVAVLAGVALVAPTYAQGLGNAGPTEGSGCAKFEMQWTVLSSSSDLSALQAYVRSLPDTCQSYRALAERRISVVAAESEKRQKEAEKRSLEASAQSASARARSSLLDQIAKSEAFGMYYPTGLDCWMQRNVFSPYKDVSFVSIETIPGETKIRISRGNVGGVAQTKELAVTGFNDEGQMLVSEPGRPPKPLDVRGSELRGFGQEVLLRCGAQTLSIESDRRAEMLAAAAAKFSGRYRLNSYAFSLFQPRNCKNLSLAIDGDYLIYTKNAGQVSDFKNKRSLIINLDGNTISFLEVGKYASLVNNMTRTEGSLKYWGEEWTRCD